MMGPGLLKKRLSKRGEAGQAAAEFALMVVFLMLFLVGFLELVTMLYTYSVLADSAKEGVRYGIVHGTLSASCNGPGAAGIACDATAVGVKTAVNTYAAYSLHDVGAMTVTPSYPDASSAPSSRVRVVVVYPYQPFFGLGWPTMTMNAASEGRITF